jgi:hypothetical protein
MGRSVIVRNRCMENSVEMLNLINAEYNHFKWILLPRVVLFFGYFIRYHALDCFRPMYINELRRIVHQISKVYIIRRTGVRGILLDLVMYNEVS